LIRWFAFGIAAAIGAATGFQLVAMACEAMR
jgi:hypothetical protein